MDNFYKKSSSVKNCLKKTAIFIRKFFQKNNSTRKECCYSKVPTTIVLSAVSGYLHVDRASSFLSLSQLFSSRYIA